MYWCFRGLCDRCFDLAGEGGAIEEKMSMIDVKN